MAVQRFPDLGERVTVSTDGGREPVWSRDGRELFFRGPRGMMVVPIETEPTFRAGDPEVLFQQQYFVYLLSRSYDVSPDGQRFLMIKEGPATDDGSARPAQITVVLNWFDELQRLVPTP